MLLEPFGFTPTETKVYVALLTAGPATGYGVARAAGLARANTYQALDGLVRRGAARRTATKPARFIAVPATTLIVELERASRRSLMELEAQLKQLALSGPVEDRPDPEAITDVSSLLIRAGHCITAAKEDVLVVLGPWASTLYPALEHLAARRVTLRALALGAPAPRGAAVRSVPEKELIAYWGGRPLLVVADHAASVCGIIGADGSALGLATRSAGVVPFLRHLLRRELASASGSA